MTKYAWAIESTDPITHTMVVAYTVAGKTTHLNLPLPSEGEDLSSWIDVHAPRAEWTRGNSMSVQVGTSGEGNIEGEIESDVPNIMGSWNEEYLRAMIYTILEEIRESTV